MGGPRKWELLDRLAEAREAFGLKHAQLGVLRALLSFHSEERLEPGRGAVVFPSNRALSERLHGMPESTMRRHLARLVESGVVERRDSPNRKRFALRGPQPLAFGFDLAPLAALAARLVGAAEAAREEALQARAARVRIRLVLAQLSAAGAAPETWAEAARAARRKLSAAALEALHGELHRQLEALPPKSDAGAARIDRSPKPEQESKDQSAMKRPGKSEVERSLRRPLPTTAIGLDELWALCPDLAHHRGHRRDGWREFVDAAWEGAIALGIRTESWRGAASARGAVWCAGVVALMLRSAARIERPDAYFRALLRRAERGTFDLHASLARSLS